MASSHDLRPPSLCSGTPAGGGGGGQMRRMYSAVPGRVYVAIRGHSAHGDRELTLSKGDRVKGEIDSRTRRGDLHFDIAIQGNSSFSSSFFICHLCFPYDLFSYTSFFPYGCVRLPLSRGGKVTQVLYFK